MATRPVNLHSRADEQDNARVHDAGLELQQLFKFCVEFIRLRLGPDTPVLVTSVLRPNDPGSVHSSGRGLDFSLPNMETDARVITVLMELTNLVNLCFPYITTSGAPGRTCVYRMKAGDHGDIEHVRHVHLQLPSNPRWGQP
jgi:hypothetical protein